MDERIDDLIYDWNRAGEVPDRPPRPIEFDDQTLSIAPNCAGRTHENDIRPIIEISQRVGIPIEAALFIGSSPIRQFAEEWELDWIVEQSTKAARIATSEGIPVMYVTEDTTR